MKNWQFWMLASWIFTSPKTSDDTALFSAAFCLIAALVSAYFEANKK